MEDKLILKNHLKEARAEQKHFIFRKRADSSLDMDWYYDIINTE